MVWCGVLWCNECQARDKFLGILGVLGGVHEKERANALLARATLIPDAPSARASALLKTPGSKLKVWEARLSLFCLIFVP